MDVDIVMVVVVTVVLVRDVVVTVEVEVDVGTRKPNSSQLHGSLSWPIAHVGWQRAYVAFFAKHW